MSNSRKSNAVNSNVNVNGREIRKDTAMKATTKNDKIETAVNSIAAKYVNRINKMALNECEGWIGIGKAISECAEEMKQKASRKNPDVDRMLAEHPDSVLHVSQIRNYRNAYDLWKKVGGEGKAPRVSLSIFTVVLNAKINPGDVEKFLKMAETEKLSVSELKARIKGRPIDATENFSFDYKNSLIMTKKGLTQAFVSLSKIISEKPSDSVPAEVKEGVVRLVKFSLAHGIVSLSDMNAV